jgi:S-DNA-T family DNA segregation ATPase FtsK/SpoIIIE
MELLEHLNNMMDSRYEYMAERGIQSVEERPDLFDNILLIIDEAADLVLYEKGKAFDSLVAKLAQKARAAGIYMVFATQRPSVDVFTGVIKANFPARLSCKVTSKVDSKVILDQQGAEALIGRGDAILNNSAFDMTRLQVAYSDPAQIVQARS